MFKAVGLGAILTWMIALLVGSQGSSGGALAVHAMMVGNYEIFWSWPLFCAGTGLTWGLIVLQR